MSTIRGGRGEIQIVASVARGGRRLDVVVVVTMRIVHELIRRVNRSAFVVVVIHPFAEFLLLLVIRIVRMLREALMWLLLLMITVLRVRIEKVVEVTERRNSVSGRGGRLLTKLGSVRVDLTAHHGDHVRILSQHLVEVRRIQLGILEGVLSARVEEPMSDLDV